MSHTSPAFFRTLTQALNERASRAVISKLSPISSPLRNHLQSLLQGPPGSQGSFLADPVFESTFGWHTGPESMEQLTGSLLTPELVDAMDKAPKDVRFPKTRHPFTHQLNAWQVLKAEPPRSIVVSSGTGSGKTECFLVPILDDLVREAKREPPLVGVRALFLYPLNALINSQRERLKSWTAPFKGNVSFCLYNGNTAEVAKKSIQDASPEEVLSRESLRERPPPLLVTNATMLEYMLVRNEDTPILRASRGKLRWIVLDEAHTYVGSKAAETALLLRRVLHAFGVRSEQVRFVATSATLSRDSGEARRRLRQYLADIAGVPLEQVAEPIQGERRIPAIPPHWAAQQQPLASLESLESLGVEERYEKLAVVKEVRRLRKTLSEGGPRTLRSLTASFHGKSEEQVSDRERQEVLRLLDLCRTASHDGESLLPLRAHLFHRTQKGVWACCSPSCRGKAGTPLEHGDWKFGALFLQRRTHCEHCQSLVFELLLCSGCGAEYLAAEEKLEGEQRWVQPWQSKAAEEEVEREEELGLDEDEDSEPAVSTISRYRLLGHYGTAADSPICFDARTGLVDPPSGGRTHGRLMPTLQEPHIRCGRCYKMETTEEEVFRPLRAGAQFFLGVAIPTLLDHVPPIEEPQSRLPFEGRRLITFSDSRQGSAQFSLRAQTEAERNYIRSLLYHKVQERVPSNEGGVQRLQQELAQLDSEFPNPSPGSYLYKRRQDLRDQLEAVSRQAFTPGRLSWADAKRELLGCEAKHWMYGLWKRRSSDNLSEEDFARLCLFREFIRRAGRQSSLETLGLVALRYPALEELDTGNLPTAWRRWGFNIQDWRDFLKISLDLLARGRTAIYVDEPLLRWMDTPLSPRWLVDFNASFVTGNERQRYVRWPQVSGSNIRSRLALLLVHGARLSPELNEDRTDINEVLREAWRQLVRYRLLEQSEQGYRLNLEKQAELQSIHRAWLCPITRRVLDTAFRGLTPYGTPSMEAEQLRCEPLTLPRLPYPFWRKVDQHDLGQEARMKWLATDETIKVLRARGVWTEFNDRIASFSAYFQVAEHSAQQRSDRLRELESEFKKGQLNLLSCSTTMEMGVDIGGLSAVAINNAPPGPANYLQRVGRAGRRQETASVGLTLCQATPHGEAVFHKPTWPFETPIHVPRVSLQSERIVQRHVNALALTRFLGMKLYDALTMKTGAFFESQGSELPAVDRFGEWLDAENGASKDEWLRTGLKMLVASSCLEGVQTGHLLVRTNEVLDSTKNAWREEVRLLEEQLQQVGGAPAGGRRPNLAQLAILRQLDRIRGEYLLSELATLNFLPGHGFARGVAPLVNTTQEQLDYEERLRKLRRQQRERGETPDDAEAFSSRRRGYPSRDLSLALREYAPGNEVVVDGLVYLSQGVTLNWHVPIDGRPVKELQSFRNAWRCRNCGATGMSAVRMETCESCGATAAQLTNHEYLHPSGFAVHIRYPKPHTNLSPPLYVPPRPPWISTGREPWVALAYPELGRFRASSEGMLFHYSIGLHGYGYAICLTCGYAVSEEENRRGFQGALPPSAFLRHTPLRGGKDRLAGEGICKGATDPNRIQSNQWLGVTMETDVFELQLHDPGTGAPVNDWVTMTSLAVALRQALAELLGIDEREIGWAAVRSQVPATGQQAVSAILYDTASGGAGYVSAAKANLSTLLRNALQIASDCPQRCDAACHSCLLTFDTQSDVRLLNRHKIKELLQPALLDALRLPERLQLLGPSSLLECDPLELGLARELQHTDTRELYLYLGGPMALWDVAAWPLLSRLLQWASSGCSVHLLATRSELQVLPLEVASPLASLVEVGGVVLHEVEAVPTPPNGGQLIAAVAGPRRCIRWATLSDESRAPGEGWGRTPSMVQHVYISEDAPLALPTGRSIQPVQLRRVPPGTALQVVLTSQLDGPVSTLGGRFWGLLERHAPGLKERLGKGMPLAEVCYSDRYLRSPLLARLSMELFRSLGRRKGGIVTDTGVQLITIPLEGDSRSRRNVLDDDWTRSEERDGALEVLLKQVGARLHVKPRHETPHARELVLRWKDGGSFTLRLDEGLGFLATEPRRSFQFTGTAKQQAALLGQLEFRVERRNRSLGSYAYIFDVVP